MEIEAKPAKDILPERGPNVIRNIRDFLIITMMLGKPIASNRTLGEHIKSVGIPISYILTLCGRYDLDSIKKYIYALADIHGHDYDSILNENLEFNSRKP